MLKAAISILIFCSTSAGAAITVTIAEKAACQNSELLVPVDVKDFLDVGSFTFFIQIDTNMVRFVGVENANSALPAGSVITNFIASGSHIAVTWFSLSAISITSGKLFDMRLMFFSGEPVLSFTNESEISNSSGVLYEDCVWEDGKVFPALQIQAQPVNTSVTEGDQAIFFVEMTYPGELDYQWQCAVNESWSNVEDGQYYSGAKSAELIITNVPISFDNYRYRCTIGFEVCEVQSDEALLTVAPLTVINKGSIGDNLLKVYPNPARNFIQYEIADQSQFARIQLLNIKGEILFDFVQEPLTGRLNLTDYPEGIYFLNCLTNHSILSSVAVIKQ